MTSWIDFAREEPRFSGQVRELFTAYKHHVMATLRRDGSPRISGTEVEFADDGLVFGVMAGARRVGDLQRDGRIAIHSHTVDPPEGDPEEWSGDAKISGIAVEVDNPGSSDGSHRFRIELTEVVFTKLGTPADHLLIETWHPDRGLGRIERH